MAYSQEVIQTNAGVTVWSIGTLDDKYIPSNALQNIVAAYGSNSRPITGVKISSPSDRSLPTFGIKFKS